MKPLNSQEAQSKYTKTTPRLGKERVEEAIFFGLRRDVLEPNSEHSGTNPREFQKFKTELEATFGVSDKIKFTLG